MYFDLGEDTAVCKEKLIGIFDMDATTVSKRTRDYLNRAQREGKIRLVSSDIPLSFVVTEKEIYLSPVSSGTLCSESHMIG